MHEFFAKPVFRVGSETFTWRDVILFGHVTGRWGPMLRGIEEGLACVRHAEAQANDEVEDLVDAAAAEFRYDRELITAAETEAWLAERDVTAGEWLESVRRRVLRTHFAESIASLTGGPKPSRRDLERAARVDLVCTESGRALAEACAEHAAVATQAGEAAPGADPLPEPLPVGLETGHVRTRLGLITRILHGVEAFRLAQLTDEALGREVRSHQMEWVRLECESVSFADLAQAREAALCLREDGLTIAEVAANAHLPVVPGRFFLDEIDEALRPVFLSAVPGEIIGPTGNEAGATVYQVRSKTMPAETDPAVRDRAAERLFARALANEGQRRVQWLISW